MTVNEICTIIHCPDGRQRSKMKMYKDLLNVLKNVHVKIVKIRNPLILYGISRIIIGTTGIIISSVSFISLIKIVKNLLKNKSYMGNEPYLASSILTLTICVLILIWGFITLISNFIDMARYSVPVPTEFEDYDEVENALVREQIPPYKAGSKTIVKKDKSFRIKFFLFLGCVTLFLIVKIFIPDDFFWDLKLTPGYFSFPLSFTVILTAVAALRSVSIFFHARDDNLAKEVSEEIKSIKGGGHPYTFAPDIEKALLSLHQNGNPNIVFCPDFSETDGGVNTHKIERKLFIETPPKPIQYEIHPIEHLYLLFAIILFIIGFFFLTKLPPDNISVLTVPTIAIDYLWTIAKGGVLLFSGWGLLKSVSYISKTYRFESVMVYVNIEGVYRKTTVRAGKAVVDSVETRKIIVRSDCHFRIYTTKLLTEISSKEGSRHIVKMAVEKYSEKAKKLVTNAIERFEKAGKQEAKPEHTKKILILSANPKTTPRLRLDEEVREIEEGLLRSKQRGQFEIKARLAVRLRDIRRALLDHKPQIVHFTGHGKEDGLIVEDEMRLAVPISAKALAGLFELFSSQVECVVLNACYSAQQAAAIKKHIDYVIGMRKEIKDSAAIEFAVGFYDALGAGRSVEEAFKFGCNAILQKFPDLPEHLIPVLKKR
jgi:hypothetical protein